MTATEQADQIFREIFKSSVEGIVVVDSTGKILLFNSATSKMFGYSDDELTGMALESLIPARYRDRHEQYRHSFHAHPEPRRMGEGRDLTGLRKDGSEIPIEISLSYIRQGEIFRVMAFISDISLRKKADEQLAIYASELEKKVQQRTEAIDAMNKNLQREIVERKKAEEDARKALEKERELNELKSRFVYVASHEFRTPLSTILSSASLAGQYLERNEADKTDKHLHRIKSSVKHLTSILNDFLSLGKLEEGKVEVLPENVVLTDFIEEVMEEIRPTLREGQHIEMDAPDGLHLQTDPRILRNILFNLISNASKYSDPGKKVQLKCQTEKRMLHISVVDEGIGIPEEDMKHIADRFFRASNVSNIQGTGLGLNIVRCYTELLKGTITFSSVYGKGSTFTLTLPDMTNA